MTNHLVSTVLREAAMYAHYNGIECPWEALSLSCDPRTQATVYYAAQHALSDMFLWGESLATSDVCVLALLFAAEAVEDTQP